MKRVSRRPAAKFATLPARGPRVGRVVGVDDGCWLVELEAGSTPIHARSTIALDVRTLQAVVAQRREALIVFERESPELPIVIGLLAPSVLDSEPNADPIELTIDGRQLTLDARDEIELRCGQARISLRRNGRVMIRGTYVETRSKGTNRIKGGNVQIN